MNGDGTTPRISNGRFGPDWPGRRCLAKTRAGYQCQKPALKGKARCQLHGGRAGAPTGARNGNYRTGRYTAEAVQVAREARTRLKELVVLGRRAGIWT
ncbi:HGGxSTG domain-containing protein [Ciceribacter thiooxidans]|uniref:HGGxSTG domain-containing protein n=1 Tax=Ciceribacter thiooxidans TaxID=1969821 RepID=A0ABV7I1R8_9HYPH